VDTKDKEFEDWFDDRSPVENPAKVWSNIEYNTSQTMDILNNIEAAQRENHSDFGIALSDGALSRLPIIESHLRNINACLVIVACALVYIAYKLSGI